MHFLPSLFLLLPCLFVTSSPPLFAAASSLDRQTAVLHAARGECSCTPVTTKGVALDASLDSLAPHSPRFPAEKREEVDKPETTLVQGGYLRLGRGYGNETEKVRYVFIENAASPPPSGLGMHVWIGWVGVVCCYLVIFVGIGRWLG